MPPVPDDALHKILQQIQTQLINSSRQLSMVKAQLQAHETGKRRIELTAQQLDQEAKSAEEASSSSSSLTADTRSIQFWQGVGKMFVAESKQEVDDQLTTKRKELEMEIANLSKKQKFLEKQVNESQGHMRDLFSGLEKQQQQQSA